MAGSRAVSCVKKEPVYWTSDRRLARFRLTLAPLTGMNLERLVIKPIPLCSRPGSEGAAVLVLLPTSRLPTVLRAPSRPFTLVPVAVGDVAVPVVVARRPREAVVVTAGLVAAEMVWSAFSKPKTPLLLAELLLLLLVPTKPAMFFRAVKNCGWQAKQKQRTQPLSEQVVAGL